MANGVTWPHPVGNRAHRGTRGMMQRSSKLLAGAAAVVSVVLVAWVLWPTPEDRIRALFEDARAAAQARNPTAVCQDVAEAFSGPRGLDRETARAVLQHALGVRYAQARVTLHGLAVTLNEEGTSAWVSMRVQARGTQADGKEEDMLQQARLGSAWRVLVRQQDSGWKVFQLEVEP